MSYGLWLGDSSSWAEYNNIRQRVQSTTTLSDLALFHSDGDKEYEDESDFSSHLITQYETHPHIAVLNIQGSLTNENAWYNRHVGLVSYDEIYDTCAELMANDTITDVVLHARSIGGVASGISTAEEALVQLGKAKNLVAYTDTTMCSAMYWLGCIADKVYTAKANISVGSIGVISVYMQHVKALKEAGIVAEVFQAGSLKAAGLPFKQMSDEERQYIQNSVDETHTSFINVVSEQRQLPSDYVRESIATGASFSAGKALELGIIDGVTTYSELIASLKPKGSTGTINNRNNQYNTTLANANVDIDIEDNTMKKVISAKTEAAIASGMSMEDALQFSEEESKKVEDTGQPEGETEGETEDETEGQSDGETEGETKGETEGETGDTKEANSQSGSVDLSGMVDKITSLTTDLALTKAKLTQAEEKMQELQETQQSMSSIVAGAIENMSIVLGKSTSDLTSLSPQGLVSTYAKVREEYTKALPVGGVVETKVGDSEEMDSMNNLGQIVSLTKRKRNS